MKFSLTFKITFLFALLIIVTLFHFQILISSEKMINEKLNWVLHTHEVIRKSERLLGHLSDAETGQRGFLLTNKNSYLKPFNIGITQSYSEFEILQNLIQDNIEQQTRLGNIQGLMREKISELEKTIGLAKQDRMAEAMEIVNSDNGKIVMDTIRKSINEFISTEEKLLEQRNALYIEQKNKLILLFYAEAIVFVTLILIFCIIIQKNIARPLVTISEYIKNEGNKLDGTGVKIKPRHDEIGILAESFNKLHLDLKEQTDKKNELISTLKIALDEVKTLKGIIPICSHCKKIRDDEGYWNQIESYLQQHSEAELSHGICQECAEKYYPDLGLYGDT